MQVCNIINNIRVFISNQNDLVKVLAEFSIKDLNKVVAWLYVVMIEYFKASKSTNSKKLIVSLIKSN